MYSCTLREGQVLLYSEGGQLLMYSCTLREDKVLMYSEGGLVTHVI